MKERFSDEHLNAYLDGELDPAERMRLLEELRRDPGLSTRVCQLQKVKEMVQLAYPDRPEAQGTPTRRARRGFGPAIAASILFLAGLLGGWLANQKLDQPATLLEIARTVRLNNEAGINRPWRLMLHVSSADTHRYRVMIDETARLLRAARKEGKPVQIEIVANGPGLQLLSKHKDPNTLRLQALAHEFDNLDLRACERAIRRYRQRNGKDIELIPEAGTVRSAMHEVIKRQQEGWAYINI